MIVGVKLITMHEKKVRFRKRLFGDGNLHFLLVAIDIKNVDTPTIEQHHEVLVNGLVYRQAFGIDSAKKLYAIIQNKASINFSNL